MGSFIDLSGQRFGRLTVESQEPTLKRGVTRWLCRCDCGRHTVTTTTALRSGNWLPPSIAGQEPGSTACGPT